MLKDFIFPICILMLVLNVLGDEKGIVRNIDLHTGNIDYRLSCKIVVKDGKEYLSGIGLLGASTAGIYSKRGWSAQNFMEIKLDGKSLYGYPVEIKTETLSALLTFAVPAGKALISIRAEEQGNRLLVAIRMPGNEKLESSLIAYPGDFNKNDLSLNLRCVATAKRKLLFPAEAKIGGDEPWIYFYDEKNNPQGSPYKSTCAVLYNPNETENVKVKVENYSVSTKFSYKDGIREIHYIFWEFPGKDHLNALKYMKNIRIEYIKPL